MSVYSRLGMSRVHYIPFKETLLKKFRRDEQSETARIAKWMGLGQIRLGQVDRPTLARVCRCLLVQLMPLMMTTVVIWMLLWITSHLICFAP